MRVVFIGKDHEFSLLSLRAIQTHHEIVAIVESGPRGSKPKSLAASQKLASVVRVGTAAGNEARGGGHARTLFLVDPEDCARFACFSSVCFA